MLVSGQNAVRAFRKSWPIVPGLHDPIRPIRQVRALEHWEKDLALYLDAHPGYFDCGTDPLVNGVFEGVIAPWGTVNGAGSIVLDPAPGTGGISSGEIRETGVGANPYFWQLSGSSVLCFVSGWAKDDGIHVARVANAGPSVLDLPVTGAWQYFVTPTFLSFVGGDIRLYSVSPLGSGGWARWDDIRLTKLVVQTWFDRTRRGGRNPTQAVVASRPVRTDNDQPSGRCSIVFDGVDDTIKSPAFTHPQPIEKLLTVVWPAHGGWNYIADGNANDTCSITQFGAGVVQSFAGAGFAGSVPTIGAWTALGTRFDGAGSDNWDRLTASTFGAVGVAAAGGITLGSQGVGAGSHTAARIGQHLEFSRVHSDSERTNLITAAMRRACI